MKNKIRVRFAPSPTGYLHIGGVRTALFNWLWARKTGGSIILRIEDTDQERSTPQSKAVILESLKWLGLWWDEGPEIGGDCGPYEQTARLHIYKHYSDKLIAEGKAYRCYCSEEELKVHRDALKIKREAGNKGAFFKYPGTCRDRKDQPNLPFVVRFKATTDGVVEYNDKVFGKITCPNKENQDFVIMRSDGIPLYNFGAVIDDMTMGMTLVARGRDHAINTPPQILLYQALGVQPPEFAHLPMMLSASGEKLSKRHNAVSATEYRDLGYSPIAVLNYLARFGWGFGNKEVFSLQELIESFSWEGCGKNDGRFDTKKFEAINAAHLRSETLTPDDDYVRQVIPFIVQRGIKDINAEQIKSLLPLIRPRAKTFVEAAAELDPFLRGDIVVDADAKAKFITDDIKTKLTSYTKYLQALREWSPAILDDATKTWMTENNSTLKEIGQPIRVAITGRTNSPELFATMNLLGKTTTIERLQCQLK